jgi:hypothetical protein
MIATLKIAGNQDWHAAYLGYAVDQFLKTIPCQTEVNLMLESREAFSAMH